MMWTWCKYVSHEQCKDPVIKGVAVRAAVSKEIVRVKPTLVAGFLRLPPASLLTSMNIFLRSLFFVFLFVAPNFVQATELLIAPDSETKEVGGLFNAVIYLLPQGQLINAAEGTIAFDPNILQVVSVSKAGSVFSLWTAEPSFDNTSGVINFSGGHPQGFSGGMEPILLVTLKAQAEGRSTLSFQTSSVLAADGLGTAVLHEALGSELLVNKVTAQATINPPIEVVRQNLTPVQAQTGSMALEYALAGALLVLVLILFFRRITVDDNGNIKKWAELTSVIAGLSSIILFEFSLIPLIAISFGYLTLTNKGRVSFGLMGVILGIVYLLVGLGLNLGLN